MELDSRKNGAKEWVNRERGVHYWARVGRDKGCDKIVWAMYLTKVRWLRLRLHFNYTIWFLLACANALLLTVLQCTKANVAESTSAYASVLLLTVLLRTKTYCC